MRLNRRVTAHDFGRLNKRHIVIAENETLQSGLATPAVAAERLGRCLHSAANVWLRVCCEAGIAARVEAVDGFSQAQHARRDQVVITTTVTVVFGLFCVFLQRADDSDRIRGRRRGGESGTAASKNVPTLGGSAGIDGKRLASALPA
jgi:hypothetical protein